TIAEEVAALGEAALEFLQRLEERPARALVRGLPGGESSAIDAVVHALVNELGEARLLRLERAREKIHTRRATGECLLEHAADVVLGVVDDAAGLFVPEHGNGDASVESRVRRRVRFAQEGEAIDGIVAVTGAIAKGPALL